MRPSLVRHFVGGQRGRAAPSAPARSTTPPRARCSARSPSRRRARSSRRSPRPAAALPGWRATGLIKRADVFFRLRQLLVERQDELAAIITSEHGKVLSDAKGEISRGIENVEFAAGLVHLLKGEHSEQVARGVDVHSVEAARRRRRRDHAVQLPRHGAAVDGRLGDRVRQHGRAEALREGPERGDLPREAVPGGRAARRRAQRRARRQGRGRRDPRLPRACAPISFVGSTPIARSIYERAAAQRQARAGARRREEPHGRHARRRPRRAQPMPRSRPPTARPASAAWPCRCSSRSATSPTSSSRRCAAAWARSSSATAPMPRARWVRSSPASTATRSPRTSTGAAAEGATVVVDGTHAAVRRRRLLRRRHASSTT